MISPSALLSKTISSFSATVARSIHLRISLVPCLVMNRQSRLKPPNPPLVGMTINPTERGTGKAQTGLDKLGISKNGLYKCEDGDMENAPCTSKKDFVEDWLDNSCWSRRTLTKNNLRLQESLVNMPHNPPASVSCAPWAENIEGTGSTPTRSTKTTLSIHDHDYRESLELRNIFIQGEAPPELLRRAKRILSRSRTSDKNEVDAGLAHRQTQTSHMVAAANEAGIRQWAHSIISALGAPRDPRLTSQMDQLWSQSIPIPLIPAHLKESLPLPRPKPDLAFGYHSGAAFTVDQLCAMKLFVDNLSGRSYAVPDQKLAFPFLQVEYKSQAKGGSHFAAANQAAGPGAIAMNGYLALMHYSFGLDTFDYDEPQYFSVTMDHQLACIYVHWLMAPTTQGEPHSFHMKLLSQYLLEEAKDIGRLDNAIKNILDYGVNSRLRRISKALDASRENWFHQQGAAMAGKKEAY